MLGLLVVTDAGSRRCDADFFNEPDFLSLVRRRGARCGDEAVWSLLLEEGGDAACDSGWDGCAEDGLERLADATRDRVGLAGDCVADVGRDALRDVAPDPGRAVCLADCGRDECGDVAVGSVSSDLDACSDCWNSISPSVGSVAIFLTSTCKHHT